MNDTELIEGLARSIQDLRYDDSAKLDDIRRRAKLVIRKVFGENSRYLGKLGKIRFMPMVVSTGQDNEPLYRSAWRSGQQEMLHFFNGMLEDLQLSYDLAKAQDTQGIEQTPANKVFVVHEHEEETSMDIRLLNGEDAAAYQASRLRSLREHPEAFSSSAEEEEGTSLEVIAEQISHTPVFGAFLDGRLVGIVSLFRFPRTKTKHRAIVGGMYVAPEARRLGAGKALMQALMTHAHTVEGLEEVVLAVTVGNEVARKLYLDAGFVPYSVEPRYIKVGDRHYDIEWMSLRL
jgi:RimJ/RimL family protein N-acetyltransferase